MKVLVVDDSKAMQNIMTKAMKHVGYLDAHYSYAGDGEAALQVVHSERPDLVLCDMHMPKMTGLELIKALRSEKDATKIIIVSIDDDEKTVASITAAGGDAYLKKPFTTEQLFNTITPLIGKSLTKKSEKGRDIYELMPTKSVIERVLSSLAAADVKLADARFEDIDYDRSPYYGGTLQDDQNRVVLAMFFDALAANTIAAIINRRPLEDAITATQEKRIDTAAKEALLASLGLFSGLCKPLKSGRLLDIHAVHFAENAHAHLSKHINQYAESLVVYSINCGLSQGGKVILLRP
jgi:CheY-like chemotaxis protein